MAAKSAIVIGAGIAGLATARALAIKGYDVTVIERTHKAVGASIRNFGMVWPIGQPEGTLYDRAMRSREVWKEVGTNADIWHDEVGSLHVAYHDDEWQVLNELYEAFSAQGRPVSLLKPSDVTNHFHGVNENGLKGGLYSSTEMIVDPRQAIYALPFYLSTKYNVQFIWGKAVTDAGSGYVICDNKRMRADLIVICSGAEFEVLYPEVFAALPIIKCKLQMMRFKPANDTRIGTSLCGGLSLIHYSSFKAAASLDKLRNRYEEQMPEYLKWGIHVMVSQNREGELTVGDSHEYDLTFDPFDKAFINQMILDYLDTFALTQGWEMIQSWNGVYPKMTDGSTDLFLNPDPGVYIINGLGGAGMTLSFGFAEECINTL